MLYYMFEENNDSPPPLLIVDGSIQTHDPNENPFVHVVNTHGTAAAAPPLLLTI